MKFQRLYRPAYQFVKKGKYYVKVEKIVNKFNGQEPNEPKIKDNG
jgi:hypothetical protein